MRTLNPKKVILVSLFLTLFLFLSVLFSMTIGSVKIPPYRTLSLLFHSIKGFSEKGMDVEQVIILSLRFPRILLAGLVGAGLSIAGVIFQVLLRNPLADPYILGVSSGSAVGAILAILLGVNATSFGLPLASFIGALFTILVVFYFGRQNGKIHPNTLLLAGVVTGSFLSAIILFLLSLSQKEELHTILFWLMGDFSFSNYSSLRIIFPYILLGFLFLYFHARHYNLLLVGEEGAIQLGVSVEGLKLLSYLSASLIAAASVSVCGLIGFVGLIVPHGVRLIFGADHRLLLPSSALIGASYLILSDTLARTILAPVELPVGVVTAAFGGPFFVYLLKRRKGLKTL